jgi:two-component system, NtrC family, sensor histidine kinase KinB
MRMTPNKMQSSESLSGGENSRTTRTSLELLYHISREFASALDLNTVLQRVLSLSKETVGARNGSIIVLSEDGRPVESTIIIGKKIFNHTTSRLKMPLEKGLAGWVVHHKEAALIQDTSKDTRWISQQAPSLEHPETRSVVSAPLLVRDSLVGVLTLSHTIPNYFNNDHLSLVQAIADQAGISVLNARLYMESRRQARVMTALAESAAAINASLHVEEVLVQILEQMSRALQVEAASLAFVDQEKEELVFKAAIGWKRENIGRCIKLSVGVAGWAATNRQGVIVPIAEGDLRFDKEIEERTGLKVHAIGCAPFFVEGKVIGVLEALNPLEDNFDHDTLLVLNGIGNLAGSAIQNAQLYESLQAAHKRYLDLFEDSIEPIIITDREGKILEANRQAALVVKLEIDMLQKMSIDQLHKIDQEKIGKDLIKIQGGETIFYESQLKSKEHRYIPVEVYVREVKIDNKSHLQWIFRDISERKNLDILREDLLSMLYHDLRSPLSNVVSSLDAIDTILPVDTDPIIKPLVVIAKRSAHRLQRLTNSLLDINRLEAGQSILHYKNFSPDEVIEESLEVVLPIAKSKQLEIIKKFPREKPSLQGDPDMIQRVFTNLLENAVKFSPTEGDIEVGYALEEDKYKFWVQDNGPGISPGDREKIFDRFTRLSSENSPKGLGLGLTFCRLAVEAHGGKIWVESEPEKFTRFYFTLNKG